MEERKTTKNVQAYMDMGYTREEAEEIQKREEGMEVLISDGHGFSYRDNIEPLFSEMQIDAMTSGQAQRFTRQKGAELMAAAVEFVKKKSPDLEGDELMHEVVRLAYIRGFNHGIRFVSTINLTDDFED